VKSEILKKNFFLVQHFWDEAGRFSSFLRGQRRPDPQHEGGGLQRIHHRKSLRGGQHHCHPRHRGRSDATSFDGIETFVFGIRSVQSGGIATVVEGFASAKSGRFYGQLK
jgi:hypothetical protein